MKSSIKLTHQEIDTLLTAAGRAPSGGNIQPWLVEVIPNRIIVKLNPKKLGMILDVNNYGSLFALGAFALNLEIAASKLGLIYTKSLLNPQSADNFHISYHFEKRQKAKAHPLFQAVLNRSTNRHISNGQLIPQSIIQQLQQSVTQSGTQFKFHAVSDNESKSAVAKALGKADLIRTKNLPLLRQMLAEMRWTKTEAAKTLDGLDIRTMELPGNVNKMLKLLTKFASLAKTVPDIALEKQAYPLLKASSHLCVLSFNQTPNPLIYYHAGYTMQRVWLQATLHKLAVHPWTVLTFFVIRARYFQNTDFSKSEESILLAADADLHRAFQLDSHLIPAFIFRLSYADPPSTYSLRYPWHRFTSIKT